MKKLLALSLALVLILGLAGCGSSQPDTSAKPQTDANEASKADSLQTSSDTAAKQKSPEKIYTIKLTTNDAGTTLWHTEHQAAIERIRERTNGGVDIQFHGSGEMMVGVEAISAVADDAALIYFTDPANFSDYCPELMVLGAPYLWESYTEIEAFQETDVFANIMSKAKAANLHLIGLNVVGSRNILASYPVTSIADCDKLILRVPGGKMYTNTFAAMGVSYQSLPFTECYNALETGMINGLEITTGNLITLRPDESMKGDKYYSLNNHMLCCAGLWCGEGFWNTLPEEYQQIITEEFSAAVAASNKAVDEAFLNDLETLKSFGITVVEVPDKSSFVEAVKEMNSELAGWDEVSAAVEALRK